MLSLDEAALRALAAALVPLLAEGEAAGAAGVTLRVSLAMETGRAVRQAVGSGARAQIVAWRNAGMSLAQIADASGRSVGSVKQILLAARKMGAALPPPKNRGNAEKKTGPRWSEAELALLEDRVRAGATAPEMAAELGRSVPTVRCRATLLRRKLGLPPPGRKIARPATPAVVSTLPPATAAGAPFACSGGRPLRGGFEMRQAGRRAAGSPAHRPPSGGAPAGLSVTPRGVGHGPVTDGESGQSAPPRPARPPGAEPPGRGSVASPQPSGRAGARPLHVVLAQRPSPETAPGPGESADRRAGPSFHPPAPPDRIASYPAAERWVAALDSAGAGLRAADLRLVGGLLSGRGLDAAAAAAGLDRAAALARWRLLMPVTDPMGQRMVFEALRAAVPAEAAE